MNNFKTKWYAPIIVSIILCIIGVYLLWYINETINILDLLGVYIMGVLGGALTVFNIFNKKSVFISILSLAKQSKAKRSTA